MVDNESVQHSNIAEEEMGQLHSIHYAENAVNAVRQRMRTGPSLSNCTLCGDDIPLARQMAVQGCRTCITCQSSIER